MLVGERMSKPVITFSPEMSLPDALGTMKKEHIRRAPVVKNGKLVGIVCDVDLLNASPSSATTLSVWEINYLLNKITVAEVMTKNVLTVTEDTPIEQAARIMADNKVGGLPVMRNGNVVGIITETDLFKIFIELLGARESGVRVTALVDDKPGQLARFAEAITAKNGNFVAFGAFTGNSPSDKLLTCKIQGLTSDEVRQTLEPLVKEFVDIR